MRIIKISRIFITLGFVLGAMTLNAATYRTARSGYSPARKTATATYQNQKNNPSNEIIIPKGLKPGDTIGLIAPANYTNENSYAEVE